MIRNDLNALGYNDHTVCCDRRGCTATVRFPMPQTRGILVSAKVREYGWQSVYDRRERRWVGHYCPRHITPDPRVGFWMLMGLVLICGGILWLLLTGGAP